MKKTISTRDLQLLSAYLDQQINAGERRKVETRLRGDDEFRRSYEQLRQTRQLLRSMPMVRAPRNFTLSPAQALRPAAFQRFIPVFGVVSAVASFLLVLAFVSSIFYFNPRSAASPSALQKEGVPQVAMQSNAAENTSAADYAMETATESALAREAPALGQLASTTETPAAPRLMAPLTSPPPEATPAGETFMMKTSPLTTTETIAATSGVTVAGSAPMQTTPGENALLTTPMATGPAPTAVQETTPQPLRDNSLRQWIDQWIPWIEGLLLLVALSTGLLYLLLRRNLHR